MKKNRTIAMITSQKKGNKRDGKYVETDTDGERKKERKREGERKGEEKK